ncbi:MAG: hypothetical protein KDA53_00805 [Hyphomonas sp.]|nr:hypothetical protein [Hyphomonas sp.]
MTALATLESLPSPEELMSAWPDIVAQVEGYATLQNAGLIVAGALAMMSGARLLIIAATVVVGVRLLLAFGHIPSPLPEWFFPAVAIAAAFGAVQGATQLLLGKDTGGNFLGGALIALLGLVSFFATSPMRLLSLLLKRKR